MGGNPDPGKSGDGNGREAKSEKRGVLRQDARWVVLLGALSAAATVLAYVGIQGPTLVHIFMRSAASSSPRPRLSRSPSPSAIQPIPTLSASLLPVVSSDPPTVPSPTQESSSPAVVPSDFDNAATDPTVISAASMLPQQFYDSGTTYSLTSSSADPCPPVSSAADAGVNNTVQSYGCTDEIIGTYLDSARQIQVAVWVIPLPDKGDAVGVYNTLTAPGTTDNWGIVCPDTGAGSQVCQGQPWQNATRGGWIAHCHRYLIHAVALYVDLAPYSSLQPALTATADAAVGAIGPQNIPIANCWASTAGSLCRMIAE